MSRLPVILIALLLLLCSLRAHEEPPKTLKEKSGKDRARAEILEKNITSYTVWKHKIKDNKPVTDSKEKYYSVFYDSRGNITEITEYGSDGAVKGQTVFGYDLQDNMVTDTDYGPDAALNDMIKYKYDEMGRVTEQTNYLAGGNVDSRFTYTIDNEIKSLVFCKYNPMDSIEYRIVYSYDGEVDHGNNILALKLDPAGNLVLKIENEYNTDNHRTRKKIYDENGDLSYYFEYGYHPGSDEFQYIKKMSPDGTLITVTEYPVNEKELISSAKTTDSMGNVLSYISYEYFYNK